MKPRNYFNKSMDTLGAYFKAVDPWIAEEFQTLQKLFLDNAQCWYIEPHVLEMIWNTEFEPSVFEKLRLPMPVMAIEYDFDYGLLKLPMPTEGRTCCPPRVTVMISSQLLEDTMKDLLEARSKVNPLFPADVVINPKEVPGLNFYQFFRDPDSKYSTEWRLTPYVTTLSYDLVAGLPQRIAVDGELEAFFEGPVPSLNMTRMGQLSGRTKFEEIQTQVYQNPMIDDIKVCLGLLQMLQCRNVPVEKIEPPKKLNVKRAKNGKKLLPSYRTLKIGAQGALHTTTDMSSGRASPRAHFRRGHLRVFRHEKYKGHDPIWIPPMLVGSGESIITDIKVK